MGFEKPTEVQAKAIPLLLQSETDLVALAQTGTGKTAAFVLPILDHLVRGKQRKQHRDIWDFDCIVLPIASFLLPSRDYRANPYQRSQPPVEHHSARADHVPGVRRARNWREP